MEREQFTFYRSYYEALKALPKRDQVSVVMAICAYALDEELPDLSGVPLSVFTLIRPTLDAGRNKAKNRINKTGTNEKQNGNKKEQKRKEKEREKEGEREKERENDSSPPKAPLPGGAPSPKRDAGKPEAEDWGFGPDLTDAFRAWLRYKTEKRQPYKPEGLKALVTETRNNAQHHGEAAVAALIRKCMASNWQGIIWDRLDAMPAASKSQGAREMSSGAWKYVGGDAGGGG